jgi:SAM-dependent methyltransferase
MSDLSDHGFTSPAMDEEAMHAFRNQWQVYSKVVDHNYLFHREACAALHAELMQINRPFRFLDLACGDARTTVAALQGTHVSHYHGIDLSAPALEMARRNVQILSCPAKLEQNDFVSAMNQRLEPVDVVWIGLSLHHLQTTGKRNLMRAVRSAVGDDGLFMIYEPICREKESRVAYLERLERINHAAWAALTPEEWDIIATHVRSADLPESPEAWTQLGRDAGFSTVRELFTDANELYAVFNFQP